MYKLCKTEQSAMRQHMLEEGLLSAMLSQRFENISVSDLCSQMGVPRKTFYRYFDGKESALMALIDHRMQLFENNVVPGNTQSVGTLNLQEFFAFWRSQKDLLDALDRSCITGFLVERAIEQSSMDGLLRLTMKHYEAAYLDEAIRFLVAGLMMMMMRWYKSGFEQSIEKMADLARSILTSPMLGR